VDETNGGAGMTDEPWQVGAVNGLVRALGVLFAASCMLSMIGPLSADEQDPIASLVGEWDLIDPDTITSIKIRPDHSVFHSRLGLGDIEHENVFYYKVEYRHTHLQCHYQIKKYSEDELSIIVSIRPAPSDCDLGQMRRAPGSIRPKSNDAAGGSSATESKSSNLAKPDKAAPTLPASASPHTLAAEEEANLKPKAVFKECPACPDMVVVPPGRFLMGSPAQERGRYDNEGPIQEIAIPKMLAVGRYSITRDEFMAFVAATNYPYGQTCHAEVGNRFVDKPNSSFLSPPGFSQQGRDPVVCVSWNDAKEYTKWLSTKTGKTYRLLSEAEREYVARAGSATPYWWGETVSPSQANYDTRQRSYSSGKSSDLRKTAANAVVTQRPTGPPPGKPRPVESYQQNPWGLFNVHGNVAEWVEDCWNVDHMGAPADGTPARTGDCSLHVLKGGAWSYWPQDIRAAYREPAKANDRYYQVGFRVARDLAP